MNDEIFFTTTEGENILKNDPTYNNDSLLLKNSDVNTIKLPVNYVMDWNPQKNITTFELSQCIPTLIILNVRGYLFESEIDFDNKIIMKHFNNVRKL